ncbi:Slc38a7 [Symbiodinium natans]|uniref:Slc38a7 protein n=1 Tax=Symbiodinium natans TaxID=878477 RepID=A0A812MY34_9DINO|nr:Slc38a7 [Symbiodinium natans]
MARKLSGSSAEAAEAARKNVGDWAFFEYVLSKTAFGELKQHNELAKASAASSYKCREVLAPLMLWLRPALFGVVVAGGEAGLVRDQLEILVVHMLMAERGHVAEKHIRTWSHYRAPNHVKLSVMDAWPALHTDGHDAGHQGVLDVSDLCPDKGIQCDHRRMGLRVEVDREARQLHESSVEVQEHHPTDLMWMTMIPCAVVGVAVAAAATTLMMQHFAPSEAVKPMALDKESEESEADKQEGGMSEVQLLFNIVKNIVGEGMLSLPAGIAGGTGLLAGSLIAAAFSVLMGYTFSIMGRTCYATGETSHKDCAAKVSGPRLAQTMAVVLFIKTSFTCLAFAIVISESFARTLRYFGLQGVLATSQAAMLVIGFLVLLPLCLQKELRVLSYTSMIGCLGQVWVVLVMHIRYVDGSYRPGGHFYDLVAAKDKPDFSDGVNYWQSSAATFVLIGSLATAYIAHYNAPKYYSQLKDATPQKFTKVVAGAFGFSLLVYFWIMAVGYLTFGRAAEGLILNNYSEQDGLVTAARMAISLAVIFAFPLGFTGFRDSMMSVFNIPQERFLPVTLVLLSSIVIAACFLQDLGLVNSLGGAIFGALITLVFPGLLLFYAGHTPGVTEFGELETRVGSFCILVLGFTLLVFGSVIVVIAKLFPEVLQ